MPLEALIDRNVTARSVRSRSEGVARVVLSAAIILTVVMAITPHEPKFLHTVNDKAQHMVAFGTLALLAAWGYRRASLFRIGERLSFLGALIEVVQAMPQVHRDCDIYDWLADTIAVAAVLGVVALARRRARQL